MRKTTYQPNDDNDNDDDADDEGGNADNDERDDGDDDNDDENDDDDEKRPLTLSSSKAAQNLTKSWRHRPCYVTKDVRQQKRTWNDGGGDECERAKQENHNIQIRFKLNAFFEKGLLS